MLIRGDTMLNQKKDKIVIMPDSFKGTMSSKEFCQITNQSLSKYFPDYEMLEIPFADGGEGTIDSLIHTKKGRKKYTNVLDPLGRKIEAYYGFLDDNTVIIETAQAAGITLLDGELDIMNASTYGLGMQIKDAIEAGAKKIIIGLGGSATNDGGAGALSALGVKFFNKNGQEFSPVGKNLIEIQNIEIDPLKDLISGISFQLMSDVDNPLCGEHGAAQTFGPQKGATTEMIQKLDQGLENNKKKIQKYLGKSVLDLPGGGAAGGIGAGFYAFFDASLDMGIEILLDMVNADVLFQETAFIITGEGKIDKQSARGKVVSGISRKAKLYNVPVLAIVGDIGDDINNLYEIGLTGILSINRVAVPYSDAKKRAKNDLALTVDNFARILTNKNLYQNLLK